MGTERLELLGLLWKEPKHSCGKAPFVTVSGTDDRLTDYDPVVRQVRVEPVLHFLPDMPGGFELFTHLIHHTHSLRYKHDGIPSPVMHNITNIRKVNV
jgi:hypothetical protein